MIGKFITSECYDGLDFESLDIIGFQYNTLLNFQIKQVLKNNSYTDVGYSFPVENKSAISNILFVIGDKEIRPQLRISEEASKEYQESKEKGYLSVLGYSLSENAIIFNFGNLPIDTKIEVHYTISYLATINNQGFFFRFPIASKDQYGYDSSLPNTISFSLKIKTDKNIRKIEANNSAIINEIDKHNASINLNEFESSIFVQTLISDQDKCTAVSSDDYIAVSVYKEFISKRNDYECLSDYFFVIDCSGSMEGKLIDKAVKCMRLMLQSLPMKCRFSIYCFGYNFRQLLPIVEYNNENVLLAMNLIKNIKANMGGTNIYNPLKDIFSQDGMLKKIFLLTDGEVDNSEEIINLVEKNKAFGNIYTVGIGSGADPGLIRNLAEVTNGKWTYVLDNENFNVKLISLLSSSIDGNSVGITIHTKETIAETIPSKPYPLRSNISQDYFVKAPFCEHVLISSEEFDLLIPVMKIEDNFGMKCLFTKMIIHEYEAYLRTHNDEAMKKNALIYLYHLKFLANIHITLVLFQKMCFK